MAPFQTARGLVYLNGNIPPMCPSFSHTLSKQLPLSHPLARRCTHWPKGKRERTPTQALEIDLDYLSKRIPCPGSLKVSSRRGMQAPRGQIPLVLGTFHPMEGRWLEEDHPLIAKPSKVWDPGEDPSCLDLRAVLPL